MIWLYVATGENGCNNIMQVIKNQISRNYRSQIFGCQRQLREERSKGGNARLLGMGASVFVLMHASVSWRRNDVHLCSITRNWQGSARWSCQTTIPHLDKATVHWQHLRCGKWPWLILKHRPTSYPYSTTTNNCQLFMSKERKRDKRRTNSDNWFMNQPTR